MGANKYNPALFMELRFKDNSGNVIPPHRVIFPIIKDLGERLELVGTAFFIATNGFFLTAKHVLQKRDSEQLEEGLLAVNWNISDQPVLSKLEIPHICWHNSADIALGFLSEIDDHRPVLTNNNQYDGAHLTLNNRVAMREKILSYSYPHPHTFFRGTSDLQHLAVRPAIAWGEIVELLPEGRPFLGGKVFRANMPIQPASSGGPVFNARSEVVGVNSRDFTVDPFEEPISYCTSIHSVLSLRIRHFVDQNDVEHEEVTVRWLAEQGYLNYVL